MPTGLALVPTVVDFVSFVVVLLLLLFLSRLFLFLILLLCLLIFVGYHIYFELTRCRVKKLWVLRKSLSIWVETGDDTCVGIFVKCYTTPDNKHICSDYCLPASLNIQDKRCYNRY